MQGKLILLIVLDIILFAPVFVLSSEASVERLQNTKLNDRTLYEQVKQTSGINKNAQIDVGVSPDTIFEFLDKIYVTNSGSDNVSVINASTHTKIKDIPVGDGPSEIVGDLDDTFYIANLNSDSISVINASTHTKIKDIPVGTMAGTTDMEYEAGEIYVSNRFMGVISVISGYDYTKIKDIPVGYFPTQIETFNGAVYVANEDIGTISLISSYNHTLMKRIPAGSIPEDIAIHREQSFNSLGREILVTAVYVANYLSDNVSVISGDNHTKIKDIPVGANPTTIAIDGFSNTVYVANEGSNSISVIDGAANKVVAGVTFRINPFNSGYILCDGLTTPSLIEQYIYVYSGDECIAKPNEGFEFVSWEENLQGNSTQPITVSRPASSLDSILDFLGIKPEEPEAKLGITKFGTFTANFKELPPAIPPEYLATLFTVVVTAFVGSWLTPAFIGWRRAKNRERN